MLTIELHQAEIPEVFSRFQEVIGEQWWLQQIGRMGNEVSRNPHLEHHLKEENQLAGILAYCSVSAARHEGRLQAEQISNVALYSAFTFAAQSLALIDRARGYSNKRANSLIRRIQNAFSRPIDARAMQLETLVATHFSLAGHALRWPEIDGGKERFDILVETLGPSGLEIECKHVTKDKGRKVHRVEALEFFHALKPTLETATSNLRTGVSVVVTVPKRMPISTTEFDELVSFTSSCIIAGHNRTAPNGTSVRVSDFDVADLGILRNPMTLDNRRSIERVTDTRNREAIVLPGNGGGLLIVVIQSAQADSMLHEVFDTLGDSAIRQLTGHRPGMFMVGLQGMDREQLHSVATDDRNPSKPTSALAFDTSTFLERPDLDHVVGVGFLSTPSVQRGESMDQSQGVSYYFPKRTSTFWNDDFSGLF